MPKRLQKEFFDGKMFKCYPLDHIQIPEWAETMPIPRMFKNLEGRVMKGKTLYITRKLISFDRFFVDAKFKDKDNQELQKYIEAILREGRKRYWQMEDEEAQQTVLDILYMFPVIFGLPSFSFDVEGHQTNDEEEEDVWDFGWLHEGLWSVFTNRNFKLFEELKKYHIKDQEKSKSINDHVIVYKYPVIYNNCLLWAIDDYNKSRSDTTYNKQCTTLIKKIEAATGKKFRTLMRDIQSAYPEDYRSRKKAVAVLEKEKKKKGIKTFLGSIRRSDAFKSQKKQEMEKALKKKLKKERDASNIYHSALIRLRK